MKLILILKEGICDNLYRNYPNMNIMRFNYIKMLLKKNKKVDWLSRSLCYPFFSMEYKKMDKEALLRRNGMCQEEYEWIKSYKDLYKGERCFIVATGPSLTTDDLDKIKDEYSFSMNSGALCFNETLWRPDFYFCQDEYVYGKIRNVVENLSQQDLPNVWVSDSIKKKYVIPGRFNVFPLHYLDHKMNHKKGYGEFKFSSDCYSCIYDAYTVTFSAMQMACYMGFKEIYLLGCDCNYNVPKAHFIEYGHKDPKAAIMGDKMIVAHKEFKKFADMIGVKVINCTRGGMLEVYPRKKIEEIIV